MRSFGIYVLSIRGNHICCDVAHDVEHFVVSVHSVGKILRSLIVLIFILERTFLELDNSLHERTILKLKLNLFYIVIIIHRIWPLPIPLPWERGLGL